MVAKRKKVRRNEETGAEEEYESTLNDFHDACQKFHDELNDVAEGAEGALRQRVDATRNQMSHLVSEVRNMIDRGSTPDERGAGKK